MIRSFRDKDTEALYWGRRVRRFEGFVGQWRVCFEWRDDGPYDVEIVDYH